MNRSAAKLIRTVAKISQRSEKQLKKSYYELSSKERYSAKQAMRNVVRDAKAAQTGD